MRIALLTYSTRPRGSVVHTLALAEALVEAGQQVTVWALGRAGDIAFFRPVQPGMTVRIVPFPEITGEAAGQVGPELGPQITADFPAVVAALAHRAAG